VTTFGSGRVSFIVTEATPTNAFEAKIIQKIISLLFLFFPLNQTKCQLAKNPAIDPTPMRQL
jgi:hypothetical protein